MKYLLKLLLITLLLTSCSSLSKNTIKEGYFSFVGGVGQQENWSEALEFKRVSWYQELTLIADVKLSEMPIGDFKKWFAKDTLELIKDECLDFYVGLSYFLDSSKISEKMFVNQLRAQGFRQVHLPKFISNIKLHPDYEKLSLRLYQIYGLCRVSGDSKIKKSIGIEQIHITFPGFQDVEFRF